MNYPTDQSSLCDWLNHGSFPLIYLWNRLLFLFSSWCWLASSTVHPSIQWTACEQMKLMVHVVSILVNYTHYIQWINNWHKNVFDHIRSDVYPKIFPSTHVPTKYLIISPLLGFRAFIDMVVIGNHAKSACMKRPVVVVVRGETVFVPVVWWWRCGV